jgi:hypothetical protein
MTNARQVPKVVAQLKGAIGIVAASAVDASVAELAGDMPISQPLILVTAREETREVGRVVAALSKLGKF